MPPALTVHIPSNILDAIYAGAKELYPRESFLLLRGKKSKGVISVSDLIVAPLAVHGRGFASFSPHMLPIDFSVVGTVHSHPSGNIEPSHVDLNYSFGRILMIVGYPFTDERCVAVYSSDGEKLSLQVTVKKENGMR